MIADDAALRDRYRALLFNAAVMAGLWGAVATGLYFANEASRAAGPAAMLAGRSDASAPVASAPRVKDDRYARAATDIASVAFVLPRARPDAALAAPARARRGHPPRGLEAERFDRCAPACESRDPLVASAAPAAVAGTAPTAPAPAAETEPAVLGAGREIVGHLVSAPMVALDTGRDAIGHLARLVP